MTTEHFNHLSEAEQERLAILIEECGEVVQVGCKILRHGYDSNNNGEMPETNRQMLERELGDLAHTVRRMVSGGDVSETVITERMASRPQRIEKYLHHQKKGTP